jgi:hypothetical protein
MQQEDPLGEHAVPRQKRNDSTEEKEKEYSGSSPQELWVCSDVAHDVPHRLAM